MEVCVGSAGRFTAFELARELAQRGHLRRLYAGYPKWKINEVASESVRTFPWVMGPIMILTRWGFVRMPNILNRIATESFDRWMSRRLEPCDVFHCLSSYGLESHRTAKARFGALTVCDRGASHIGFQTDMLSEEHARWGLEFEYPDKRIVERELMEYEECDLIITPSTFVHRSFVERGIQTHKLAKVPYGVDLELFSPVPKEDKVFRTIYVGKLNLGKGIPYLLEALASVQGRDIEHWLIGGLSKEIQPFLAKYNGAYRHLGVIPRSRLRAYYSQGSVFVLASVDEGFGLVMAQAMACGLPVIATENTGARDLFTDGVEGFIVPIRNPQAILEKIQFLYEHPDVREEMARAALRRVRAFGGWREYGDRVVARYLRELDIRA